MAVLKQNTSKNGFLLPAACTHGQDLETMPKFMFRALRSSDKAHLNTGLKNMSLNNRYKRFSSAMNQLPDPLLKHLTDIDHLHHEAVGALDVSIDPPHPAAVARYIREDKHSNQAEFAVTVVDAYQRQGLARILLATLLIVAQGRGIDRFWCQVQVDNWAMRQLAASFGAVEKLVPETGLILEISTQVKPEASGIPNVLWQVARAIAAKICASTQD